MRNGIISWFQHIIEIVCVWHKTNLLTIHRWAGLIVDWQVSSQSAVSRDRVLITQGLSGQWYVISGGAWKQAGQRSWESAAWVISAWERLAHWLDLHTTQPGLCVLLFWTYSLTDCWDSDLPTFHGRTWQFYIACMHTRRKLPGKLSFKSHPLEAGVATETTWNLQDGVVVNLELLIPDGQLEGVHFWVHCVGVGCRVLVKETTTTECWWSARWRMVGHDLQKFWRKLYLIHQRHLPPNVWRIEIYITMLTWLWILTITMFLCTHKRHQQQNHQQEHTQQRQIHSRTGLAMPVKLSGTNLVEVGCVQSNVSCLCVYVWYLHVSVSVY